MNDLPVPQGDWQEAYQKKQAKYNAVLVAGIAMLATAIGLVSNLDVDYFAAFANLLF